MKLCASKSAPKLPTNRTVVKTLGELRSFATTRAAGKFKTSAIDVLVLCVDPGETKETETGRVKNVTFCDHSAKMVLAAWDAGAAFEYEKDSVYLLQHLNVYVDTNDPALVKLSETSGKDDRKVRTRCEGAATR